MSIELNQAAFTYVLADGRQIEALKPTSLSVAEAEVVAIIGANGSGKSTVAKLISGLLKPSSGSVVVDGREACDRGRGRPRAGLVLQNPDNQIVATIVEDDVAFGPENLALAPAEIRARVDDALAAVGMSSCRLEDPHKLSAGQRQRVAIAGAIALRPRYLVLDEPTSMLDPSGRQEIRKIVAEFCRKIGIGVVYITHIIEEAVFADKVAVFSAGQKVAEGRPKEVLSNQSLLEGSSLYVTKASLLAKRLAKRGLPVSSDLITTEEVATALCLLS